MKRILISALVVLGLVGGVWAARAWTNWRADITVRKLNDDVENLFIAFQKYKEHLGHYPVGGNAEIARALTGKNPKSVIILVARKSDLNEKGEFVDPWGSPLGIYFAGNSILIRSAGPNKVFEDSAVKDSDDYFRSN